MGHTTGNMRFLILILLACRCQAENLLFLSGKSTLPFAVSAGYTPTNTTLGLVNWWKFDANTGTIAADSAGSATGSFAGSNPEWITGKIGSALTFDGVGAWVQLATNANTGSGSFTVSAWVYPTNSNPGSIVYDSDANGAFTAGFMFFSADGKITLQVVGNEDWLNKVADSNVPVGEWTHIMASWSGTITDPASISIYTNGVLVAPVFDSHNGAGTHAANTTTDRFLGGTQYGGGSLCSARLDDIRIWNRVLSAGEISNMNQWRGEP